MLFRVLFLVSNEAKGCSTPNSTPLVRVLFIIIHSNRVLFMVFSFKSFGVLKTVPFGVRQLFKLALCLALDTSLKYRFLVLNGVLKAVPNGVLKECYLQCCTPNGVFCVVHSFKSSTFKYTNVGQLGHMACTHVHVSITSVCNLPDS